MKNKHRATPSASAASSRSGTRSCAGARHNTSIERTYNGGWPCAASAAVCAPLYAAHVERYASAAVRCFSNVGLVRGLRAQSAVPRALRMSATLSALGQFAPCLARSAVLFAQASACSQVQATQTPRRECVLCEPSLACTPRRGRGALLRRLHVPVLARTNRRSAMAAPRWACANSRSFTRTQNALRCAPPKPFASSRAGASRLSSVSAPGSHNPSIERTNNGGRQLAVLRAVHAPLFAAHVERYASAAEQCFSNVGLVRGLRAQSAVPRALRMSATLSVLGRFAPHLVRSAVLFAHVVACSHVRAVQTPRRECVLCKPSLACTPRRGRGALLRRLHVPVLARTNRRSAMAAPRWAYANSRSFTRTQNALRCAPSRPWGSSCASASRLSGGSGPGSHNPSIERTPDGAAHVER
jgi:hypothetical protein